jgi:hypothetical protein
MKIFGQVLDTGNEPMAFANVTIITGANANKMGTQSDLDGNFVLENASISPESQFRISYIGYKPTFRKASELQGQKIKLADDVEELQEVVVNVGKKPSNASTKPAVTASTKQKFVKHLQDHKVIYAGIGGLAGILLIVRAFKR